MRRHWLVDDPARAVAALSPEARAGVAEPTGACAARRGGAGEEGGARGSSGTYSAQRAARPAALPPLK